MIDRSKTYLRRAQRRDRVATHVITLGGIAVIGSVVLILVLIVSEALPLLYPASVEGSTMFSPDSEAAGAILAVGMDEYLSSVFTIHEDGTVQFRDFATGAVEAAEPAPGPSAPRRLRAVSSIDGIEYTLLWDDDTASLVALGTRPEYEAGERRLRPVVRELAQLAAAPEASGVIESQMRQAEHGSVMRVDLLAGDRFAVTQQVVSEDLLGERTSETHYAMVQEPLPGAITDFVLDTAGVTLYAATDAGFLVRWDLRAPGRPELLGSIRIQEDGAVTALAPVLGDVSLAVGDGHGRLATWSPMGARSGSTLPPRATHVLASHASPVRRIVPSQRSKSLLSLDETGTLHLDHMTSERHLLALTAGTRLMTMNFAPRGNGIVALDADDRVWVWAISNPHPEAGWRTLFGKVWYENYPEPAYVWQSSAATDEFEPKLSLAPLVFGSLKGTFYAMVYALPLALFGAVYISQFAADRVRAVVKPAVEIMAAVPSVVIGFLCALWLAPIVEDHVVAFLVSPIILLAAFLVFVLLWQGMRKTRWGAHVERGYEFLALVPVLVLSGYAAYWIGRPLENLLFDGDFALWLFQNVGERYDQRNSIVIAFGLGFAVIPIIFTIADDAISSVPYSLKAASMALGATRWQTVWRVVLPAASPGIFAGTMIGFGRAVGETMIVLMATGNTPIMDWSIFNGMRTLSANIAVEIPEAPVGGTLYRVLFLSAVLLFVLTFAVNTVAELVRQRLRKKYGQFQ